MTPQDELIALRNRVAALEALVIAMAANGELALSEHDTTIDSVRTILVGPVRLGRTDQTLAERMAAELLDDAQAIVDQIP